MCDHHPDSQMILCIDGVDDEGWKFARNDEDGIFYASY